MQTATRIKRMLRKYMRIQTKTLVLKLDYLAYSSYPFSSFFTDSDLDKLFFIKILNYKPR